MKTDQALKYDTDIDYYEYYQNYTEVIDYLQRSNEEIDDPIPQLVKPGFFNRQLGVIWTIAVLGVISPVITLILLAMFFPIAFPYLIIRGMVLTLTKNKLEEARVFLMVIVRRLEEQKVENSGAKK